MSATTAADHNSLVGESSLVSPDKARRTKDGTCRHVETALFVPEVHSCNEYYNYTRRHQFTLSRVRILKCAYLKHIELSVPSYSHQVTGEIYTHTHTVQSFLY